MGKITLSILFVFCFSLAHGGTVRIWYNLDGTIRQTICPEGIQRSVCISDAVKADTSLSNLEYDDIDSKNLPKNKNRGAWVGGKGKGVSVDAFNDSLIDWEKEMAMQEVILPGLIEDHWDSFGIENCGDQDVIDKYHAKKQKRAEKPVK